MFADGRLTPLLYRDVHNFVAPARQEVIQVFRSAMELLGANDEVHVRQAVNQPLPTALGHAAHKAEDGVGTAPAGLGDHVLHLPKRLLLRQIAHAASVEQDHVGSRLGRSEGVALRNELGSNGFAVPLIHLAPVGLDINARHGLPSIGVEDTTAAAGCKGESDDRCGLRRQAKRDAALA